MRLLSSRYLVLYYQGRGLPQLAQNLPLLTLPQEQVHSSAGLGLLHLPHRNNTWHGRAVSA